MHWLSCSESGEAIKAAGMEFGHVFTSVLKRAIQTSVILLDTMKHPEVPKASHWRLNERHYGALQGLNRVEVAEKYGDEQVKLWRRSFDVPPPPCPVDSEYYPGNDARYADIPRDEIPNGESLQLTIRRVLPYFEGTIVPELRKGKPVLVVAHGNSLRGLMMHLEKMTPEQISNVNLPTGVPLVYELDDNLNVVNKRFLIDEATLKVCRLLLCMHAGENGCCCCPNPTSTKLVYIIYNFYKMIDHVVISMVFTGSCSILMLVLGIALHSPSNLVHLRPEQQDVSLKASYITAGVGLKFVL
ncbi:bifunctional Phosphoglycerate mutase 1/Histidine phosphatase superfamily [Babesia duncani]|uniref:phosphoglycerate mutase (2,3-diphosphoglycerate-dependent) n=1 Tax=Babesia duncani TaxID=323732 RepID=A0AAD9PKD6_9APIC|nr:bifunctional Phosphoglycerate mutase 1/Histidine phosphatase superfamily [Babesia duncani]KAK2196456.1 bifunctional Phosphoglycerate mutase 1/Histidine phosphatase superfamily [Babesia duncani]